MRLDLIATLIFSLSGLVSAGLQANQHFLLPALAPALYDVGQIFGAVVLAPDQGYQLARICPASRRPGDLRPGLRRDPGCRSPLGDPDPGPGPLPLPLDAAPQPRPPRGAHRPAPDGAPHPHHRGIQPDLYRAGQSGFPSGCGLGDRPGLRLVDHAGARDHHRHGGRDRHPAHLVGALRPSRLGGFRSQCGPRFPGAGGAHPSGGRPAHDRHSAPGAGRLPFRRARAPNW